MKHAVVMTLVVGAFFAGISCAQSPRNSVVGQTLDGPAKSRGDAPLRHASPPPAAVVLVRDQQGKPLPGALVALTYTGQDSERLEKVSDANGVVAVEKDGAFTASALTADAFGTIAVVESAASPATLTLDHACETFEGTVHDQSTPPGSTSIATVRIYQYQGAIKAPFVAEINAQQRFRGCLPTGQYFVETSLEAVGGATVFDLPLRRPLHYVGTTPSAAKTRPPAPSAGLPPLSTEQFARQLPGHVAILAMGDSSHGVGNYTAERAKLSLVLAKQGRLRYILLEAGFGETLALDRYVRGGRIDLRKVVAALGYWMWDTEEFVEAMRDIRAFNKTRSPRDQVGVLGIDIQYTSGVASFLIEQKSLRFSDDERRALASAKTLKPASGQALSSQDKIALRSLSARIMDAHGSANRIALAARALSHFIELSESKFSVNQEATRDRLMADMAIHLVGDDDRLSLLWAYVRHVARTNRLGQPPMGAYLGDWLGARYLAIAMLGKRGTTRAWDSEKKVGVIPHALEDAPDYSVESALGAPGNGLSYVVFRSLPSATRDWLASLRYLRAIGGIFVEDDRGWELVDMAAFDGVVVFDTVSSSRPTRTGVRTAMPKASGN